MEIYDVIIIGAGGMGSAAAFELARRGRRVLALEQFNVGHNRGSSHGGTRIIRKAYFEHPDYVPLLHRAYERWYELEQICGKRLLTECGVLSIGHPGSSIVAGVERSAADHGLPLERFSRSELRTQFPQFHLREEDVAVLEREAGFLAVEECVLAHATEARRLGTMIREQEEVVAWRADDQHVEVVTRFNRYSAERLIITAGAWATRLLDRLGVPFNVMRQVPMWFGTSEPASFRRDCFPCYIVETSYGDFYGFPVVDLAGLKVAQHYGAAELTDPSAVDWSIQQGDELPLRKFLSDYLPSVDGPVNRSSICMYTVTPDRHFVIDLDPRHPNVAIAAGFSGHGFKFASVVGEIVADLCDDGRTEYPIEMFRATRFAGSGTSH
jgi:sarcosine oxidase